MNKKVTEPMTPEMLAMIREAVAADERDVSYVDLLLAEVDRLNALVDAALADYEKSDAEQIAVKAGNERLSKKVENLREMLDTARTVSIGLSKENVHLRAENERLKKENAALEYVISERDTFIVTVANPSYERLREENERMMEDEKSPGIWQNGRKNCQFCGALMDAVD